MLLQKSLNEVYFMPLKPLSLTTRAKFSVSIDDLPLPMAHHISIVAFGDHRWLQD
jgi:hypothetical protein